MVCEFVSFISRDRSLNTHSQACRPSNGSLHLQRVKKRARMERDALCADWVCVHLLHYPCATPVLLCCWLGSTHLLHASCAAHATPVLTLSGHACCTLPSLFYPCAAADSVCAHLLQHPCATLCYPCARFADLSPRTSCSIPVRTVCSSCDNCADTISAHLLQWLPL